MELFLFVEKAKKQTLKLRVYPNQAQKAFLFLCFRARQFAYHLGVEFHQKDMKSFYLLKPTEKFLVLEQNAPHSPFAWSTAPSGAVQPFSRNSSPLAWPTFGTTRPVVRSCPRLLVQK